MHPKTEPGTHPRGNKMKRIKGTPTSLNLRALHHLFGGKLETSNRIERTAIGATRRCFDFGLVVVDRASGVLRLTELGCDTLSGWAFDQGSYPYGSIMTAAESLAQHRAASEAVIGIDRRAPILTLLAGGVR